MAKNEKTIIKILNENNFTTEDCILIIRTLLLKTKRLLEIKKISNSNKNLDDITEKRINNVNSFESYSINFHKNIKKYKKIQLDTLKIFK